MHTQKHVMRMQLAMTMAITVNRRDQRLYQGGCEPSIVPTIALTQPTHTKMAFKTMKKNMMGIKKG